MNKSITDAELEVMRLLWREKRAWFVVLIALLLPYSRFIMLPVNSPVAISETVDYYLATNDEVFDRIKPYEVTFPDGYIGVHEADMATVDALVPAVWTQELPDRRRLIYPLGAELVFAYFLVTYLLFCGKLKRRNIPAGIKCAVALSLNNRHFADIIE
jgi:hypothetical protein